MFKMKKFSSSWKSSKKQKKQRKYVFKAPLHIKQKLVHAHLSKELRKKYSKRNSSVRKGDKVKVLRGQFKKHEGKVERVDLKNIKIFIAGVEKTKKDGNKALIGIHPSNLMIVDLNMDDKLRQKILERK